jgi:hypothetical protein
MFSITYITNINKLIYKYYCLTDLQCLAKKWLSNRKEYFHIYDISQRLQKNQCVPKDIIEYGDDCKLITDPIDNVVLCNTGGYIIVCIIVDRPLNKKYANMSYYVTTLYRYDKLYVCYYQTTASTHSIINDQNIHQLQAEKYCKDRYGYQYILLDINDFYEITKCDKLIDNEC